MVEEVHELGKDGEDEGKPDEDEEEDENEEAPARTHATTEQTREDPVERARVIRIEGKYEEPYIHANPSSGFYSYRAFIMSFVVSFLTT